MSLRHLPGCFSLQRSRSVEVPPNGVVVDASSDGHKEVPDGVGKGDAAVAFEEDHPQAVEESTSYQLQESVPVGLGASREGGLSDGHGVLALSPPLYRDRKCGPSCRVQSGPFLCLLLQPSLP